MRAEAQAKKLGFEKAQALRDRFALQREDGSTTWIEFFNSEVWCRNRFQVTSQITIEGRRTNRYDVTLLVNGLPLGQIELKRRGVEIAQAFFEGEEPKIVNAVLDRIAKQVRGPAAK